MGRDTPKPLCLVFVAVENYKSIFDPHQFGKNSRLDRLNALWIRPVSDEMCSRFQVLTVLLGNRFEEPNTVFIRQIV